MIELIREYCDLIGVAATPVNIQRIGLEIQEGRHADVLSWLIRDTGIDYA